MRAERNDATDMTVPTDATSWNTGAGRIDVISWNTDM